MKGNSCLYARFMHNTCVKFCPIFNLAVMFFMHFNITNELNKINFTDDDWFNMMVIANLKNCSDFKYMKNKMKGKFYTDGLKKIAEALGIRIPSGLHFGRKLAVIILEILQTPLNIIQEFRQWNTDVCTEAYSQRLCIPGCKSISGYEKGDTSYYNERAEIPEDSFEKRIWSIIDQWIPETRKNDLYEAYKYLNTLKQFRRVLCQDLAYLKITNEDHWLLHETPFNIPEFETYTQKAKVVIPKSNNDKLKRNKVINGQAINEIIEY